MDKDIKDYTTFVDDVKQFILSHQYIQDENAGVDIIDDDDLTIELHTVDGAYERILIKIIPVA